MHWFLIYTGILVLIGDGIVLSVGQRRHNEAPLGTIIMSLWAGAFLGIAALLEGLLGTIRLPGLVGLAVMIAVVNYAIVKLASRWWPTRGARARSKVKRFQANRPQ